MSNVTRETSSSFATLWKKTSEDEFGRSIAIEPELIRVCYDVNVSIKYAGSRIDNIPKSVMFKEMGFGSDPKKGDRIKKGDFTSVINPEDVDAEIVKSVEIQDCSLLGEIDDLVIMTD